MKSLYFSLMSVLALTAAVFVGCETGDDAASADVTTAESHDHDHDHDHDADHDHAAEGELPAGLAKLSPEDRTLALAQGKCPVGGELGAMGKPAKITIDGRDIFLCCDGCEEKVRENPEEYEDYFAKVEQAKKAE